jgi:nicotinamide mononucleotide (NMN) deamidase PncC
MCPYTKAQKPRGLGALVDLLRRKGAVCVAVACEMAEGALAHWPAEA